MTTLATFRQNYVNVDLGLDLTSGTNGDGDVSLGTTTVRNQAISVALARLWPRMPRLVTQSPAVVVDQLEYTLTSIRDVEAIDLIDSDGHVLWDRIPSWRLLLDENTAATVARTLRLSTAVPTETTFRVVGYVPYASQGLVDATVLEVPDDRLWIVTIAARAELYRRAWNQRVNFKQYINQNRDTDVTMADLMAAYRVAQAEFEDAISQHPRTFAGSQSAIFRPA